MKTFGLSTLLVTSLLGAFPALAAPVGEGSFSGASSHSTSGSVSVSEADGKYVVDLGEDFVLDGAPDPYVSLGTAQGPSDGGLIAILKSNTGAQTYSVTTSDSLNNTTHVIIWCKRYSVPLGIAEIK